MSLWFQRWLIGRVQSNGNHRRHQVVTKMSSFGAVWTVEQCRCMLQDLKPSHLQCSPLSAPCVGSWMSKRYKQIRHCPLLLSRGPLKSIPESASTVFFKGSHVGKNKLVGMRECRGVIRPADLSSRGSEMTSGGYALDQTVYHSAEAQRQTIAVTPAGKTEPPIHPWRICLDSERNPEGGHGRASTNGNHAPMSPCFVMISNVIPPISGITNIRIINNFISVASFKTSQDIAAYDHKYNKIGWFMKCKPGAR